MVVVVVMGWGGRRDLFVRAVRMMVVGKGDDGCGEQRVDRSRVEGGGYLFMRTARVVEMGRSGGRKRRAWKGGMEFGDGDEIV